MEITTSVISIPQINPTHIHFPPSPLPPHWSEPPPSFMGGHGSSLLTDLLSSTLVLNEVHFLQSSKTDLPEQCIGKIFSLLKTFQWFSNTRRINFKFLMSGSYLSLRNHLLFLFYIVTTALHTNCSAILGPLSLLCPVHGLLTPRPHMAAFLL